MLPQVITQSEEFGHSFHGGDCIKVLLNGQRLNKNFDMTKARSCGMVCRQGKTMGLYEETIKKVWELFKKSGETQASFAARIGVSQGTISNLQNPEKGSLKFNNLAKMLEEFGATISFPDQQNTSDNHTAREVCFVTPKVTGLQEYKDVEARLEPPNADDFLAVPLVDQAVAAGPGLIPSHPEIEWMMVYAPALPRQSRSMCAVWIGRNQNSMVPTLHPRDIVLIDKSVIRDGMMDPRPPGNIYLVQEPDGGLAIKRVMFERKKDDLQLVFYSDNAVEHPPRTYKLIEDFEGNMHNALIGWVIWAWTDVTRK